MSGRGCYIVFEGIDGVGKSTQIDILIDKLGEKGIKAHYVHDTKGTERAKEIYLQVTDPESKITASEEIELFNLARKESLKVVDEILIGGDWCVADRSWYSTVAYQGNGRKQDVESVYELSNKAAFLKADLTIVLDLDVKIALSRAQERSNLDRFEQLDFEFHDRVREGFLDLVFTDNLPKIDANQSPEMVADEVWQLVKPLVRR